ncbi:MAG: hypothetical protein IPN96_20510 [Anaerolineales bacterium]|nr:hypothetical protein [Anaerolineales bacterium]
MDSNGNIYTTGNFAGLSILIPARCSQPNHCRSRRCIRLQIG